MPYILHYHDDTDDKAQTTDEWTASAILCGYYGASVLEYWEKVVVGANRSGLLAPKGPLLTTFTSSARRSR